MNRFCLSKKPHTRRRICPLLLSLLSLSLLTGCAAFGTSYTKLEQFRVVQTLGIDRRDTGLRLSLATASGDRQESDAICLSADGPTIASAMVRVQSRSTEETLFCGHIRQLVVGERADLGPLLRAVKRSADLRLDTPLWLLRESSAETVLSGAGSGSRGITEILTALQGELDQRGGSDSFTAGRILQDLERQGSALACVLDYTTAAEQPGSAANARSRPTDSARTAVLAGFAVIQDGKVQTYLKADELLGITLLRNHPGVQHLTLRDRNGANTALEIREGSTRVRPVWSEEGELQGLDISAKVSAVLLEGDTQGLSELYIDDLTARLEAAVSEQLRGLLRRSKLLQADFLGLGPRVEAASPLAYRRLERPFAQILPELDISLTVQGSLEHEYDTE